MSNEDEIQQLVTDMASLPGLARSSVCLLQTFLNCAKVPLGDIQTGGVMPAAGGCLTQDEYKAPLLG